MREPTGAALENRVREFFERMYEPGALRFHGLIHVDAHPNGNIAFSGTMFDAGGGFPVTRIGIIRPRGELTLLSTASHNDTDPKWSPDGRWLAFLSDRTRGGGNFQLCLADASDLTLRSATPVLVDEVVESHAWSADSRRVLLQSADAGADAAGSAATARIGSREQLATADWMPKVQKASHGRHWRHARIWDLDTDALTSIGAPEQNVWEASWCGAERIVAVISDSPTEGGWYQTEIGIASSAGGPFVRFVAPDLELAGISGSPDGRHLAVIEGRFHRTVQLGSLVIHDVADKSRRTPLESVQVSALRWRTAERLFFAGMAPPETVAGTLDLVTGQVNIEWRSSGTAGRKVPNAAPAGQRGVVLAAHSFAEYPALKRVDDEGCCKTLLDLRTPAIEQLLKSLAPAKAIRWRGSDGLEIQGYLALPPGIARPPLVLYIHGGPSHLFRDSWSFDNAFAALLVTSGYAVLCPNPRGSSGRGLDFASRVMRDWGGEDASDLLAGVDFVQSHFDIDATRTFVMGGSYGGYMTCWLIGHTRRFRAACAMVPVTDMRSFYFSAHHPEFLSLYMGGNPYENGKAWDERSPLTHADQVTTPTLLIAGELDNTAPPSQAAQFFRALVLRGTPTELARYPQEGHAPARYEAQIDQATRVLDWFERWK
jgi:dipeptidyl aminopeptidase/acylaminoacyl peptidase